MSSSRASSETRISRPQRGADEISLGQLPRERQAAERADEAALLVGEVDRLERDRKLEAGVLHGPKHLERADDAERAVEPAAALDRIEVRAEQERACCRGRARAGRPSGWRRRRFSSRALRRRRARGTRRAPRDALPRTSPARHRRRAVAPIAARASKSARRRSASTRSEHGRDASPDRAASQSRHRVVTHARTGSPFTLLL